MKRAFRSLAAIVVTALAVAAAPGCGRQQPADPDQARATLVLALDAWRDGRTIDDVSGGSPSIVVADPSWKAGYRLSRYEVADTTRAAGFDLKIPVELWLENPQGKPVREKVKYTVSIRPSRTVIRAPL
ncbi:MAG: hypothetical protein ACYC61_17185 [Isosphaeraceae bacterium]